MESHSGLVPPAALTSPMHEAGQAGASGSPATISGMDEPLYRPTDVLLSALDGFDSGRDSARDWSEASGGPRETPARARVTVWEPEDQKPRRKAVQPGINHFGEQLRGHKLGHRMTRELYGYPNRSPHQRLKRETTRKALWESTGWMYRDEDHTRFSDLYLLVNRDLALVNYNMSMRYFASLDSGEFEDALQAVLSAGRTFKSVESLPDWDGVAGAYIMVFDEYKQFYVGQGSDIRKRIKQHWGGKKSFDRLVYGSHYGSILPVDELRAMDTTRIYAARSQNPYAVEQRAEGAADQRFCLNRMLGGEATPLMLMLTGLNPRARAHGFASLTLSEKDQRKVKKEIQRLIERGGPHFAEQLAGLDLGIYSVARKDGEQRFWSRRDEVTVAAMRGRIGVEQYAEFLTGIGETVVWPDK